MEGWHATSSIHNNRKAQNAMKERSRHKREWNAIITLGCPNASLYIPWHPEEKNNQEKNPEKIKWKPIEISVSDSTKLGTEIFLIKTEILYKNILSINSSSKLRLGSYFMLSQWLICNGDYVISNRINELHVSLTTVFSFVFSHWFSLKFGASYCNYFYFFLWFQFWLVMQI
jgi:hypothetical protein